MRCFTSVSGTWGGDKVIRDKFVLALGSVFLAATMFLVGIAVGSHPATLSNIADGIVIALFVSAVFILSGIKG